MNNLNKLYFNDNSLIGSKKLYQFNTVLFDSILFVPFINGLFKSLFIKDYYLAAYPSEPIVSNIYLFLISIAILFIYIILLPINSCIFVSPISLSTHNSRFQIFSSIGLIYNLLKFFFILFNQLTNTYYPALNDTIYLFLFLGLIYLLFTLIKIQPFYDNIVNNCRSGTWSSLIVILITISFSILYNLKGNLYTIIMSVIGVIFLFVGFFLNKIISNRNRMKIYDRFKNHMSMKRKALKIHNSKEDGKKKFDTKDNKSQTKSSNSPKSEINKNDKREPIIVFKEPREFELSCRFLNYELYPKNPYIHIYYAYLLAYNDIKRRKDYHENIEKKMETTNNIYSHIINASECKTNFLSQYYIKYIYLAIKDNYEDKEGYSKRNSLELHDKIIQIALNNHVSILELLKQFFIHIKHNGPNDTNDKYFDLNSHLCSIKKLKTIVISTYHKLINMYPDDQSSFQLFTLFNSTIVEYLTEMNLENTLNNNGNLYSSSENVEKLSVTESNTKKERRRNLITGYTKRSHQLSILIISIYEIELVLYTLMVIFNSLHLYRYNTIISDYSILSDVDYYINNLLSEIKLMCLAIMERDEELAEEHFYFIENDYLAHIESNFVPLLKKYSNIESSTNPLITYISGESEYIYLNGYEFVSRVVYYAWDIVKTPYQTWCNRVESGENILEDDILRFLSDNYPDHANKVLQDTIDYIRDIDNTSNNLRKNVIYIGVTFLVALSLYILIFGITPLLNYSKMMEKKTINVFKHLMKGSVNEIIEKFNDDINAIIETYDFNFEGNGKINEKIEKGKKKIVYYYKKALQENIYMGKLGLEPLVEMDYLDEIYTIHECFTNDQDLCENVKISIEYGIKTYNVV
ncbi:hypothetical protein BCR32DRAFT_302015 [Anaeromyces robustus]|uniref:Uncharacterized protein n=1 Tax=Anaeromyces robustus TaxID=1754192 RepID=A0A1Y1XLY3_9FUNG|nr:hypothetical protein BCR32DRAFT_302015 [Anaeromyces robustus]|eukprot:ORX86354.1 hypothetical protein BCR32DRAFT_302015 [Anaeromyces robustus]